MRRLAILLALVVCIAAPADAATTVFINEFHYDNTGTDAGEFVEVAGPAGTSLAGWSIVLYNGATGAVYDTDPLSGSIPNQQNGFGTVSISYPSNGIQNGAPDGIALVNASGVVVQFLSYEGTFLGVGGAANGMTSVDIGVSQAGTEPIGSSLQLQGSGTTYENFTWASTTAHTQNGVNTGQSFGGVVTPTLSINDVTVTEGNSGTVTATFQVTLSPAATGAGVTFDIATANDTASAPSDYTAKSLTGQSIASGGTSYVFTVNVNGDTAVEGTERFFVNVTNVTGANVGDGQGVGTILDDDSTVTSNVIINEVDSDTPSTDIAEFVELYDGGIGNTSLNGLVVVFFNGTDDRSYAAFDLDGATTDAAGYFVLGNAAVPGVDRVFANGILQNGQDAVAIYAANASDFPNGTLVSTTNLIDAIVYGTDDPDDPGLQLLLAAGETQVNENSGGQAANQSLGRCPNGGGGARDTSAYGVRTPTPGAANDCPLPPVPRPIHQIQGTDAASPYAGTGVITTGVVTFKRLNGFFMQTRDVEADTDPNTSQGIFVFTSTEPTVALGDYVSVTGLVDEFFNLTQVRAQTDGVTLLTSGNALPAPVMLTSTILNPNGTITQLERLESMRVHAASLTSIAPTNGFGEIFTVLAGTPRPFREEGLEASHSLPSGAPATIPRFDENPERLMVDTDGRPGATALVVTSNVTLGSVTGPLDFSFGDYKVIPEATPSVSPNMTATPVPMPGANEFTVGSMNLLNFFLSNANFTARLNKASLAIRNVMRTPDIIGFEEVGDIATLTALANKVNADAVAAGSPNPQYQAYLLEGSDEFAGDDIDVGVMVKSARVNVLSVTQEGKGLRFTDPTEGDQDLLFERPPLVLRATVNAPTGSTLPVTVIVNHLQSLIDIDDPVRGPRQRKKRQLQAEFVANLVQNRQSETLVMVGDFNAFQFNDGYVDVMGTIKGDPTPAHEVTLASPDLVNPNATILVETSMLTNDQRYSYVFGGNAQTIDHVVVNGTMMARASRFAYARNNADFPEAFGGDASRSERVSDHDMPVAYFTFPPPAADLAVTKTGPPSALTGSTISYSVTVRNNGPDNAANATLSDSTATAITGPAGWTCSATSCTTPSLAIGATANFTVTADLPCATADGTVRTNTASASSSYTDPNTANNSASAVVVASNPAPVITGASVDKHTIGPPNHKMELVTVNYSVADNCGAVTTVLTVASNQPIEGTGDGDTSPDWEVVDANHVLLRAERAATDGDRVYTITITATDTAGGTSSQNVTVSVPRSARP